MPFSKVMACLRRVAEPTVPPSLSQDRLVRSKPYRLRGPQVFQARRLCVIRPESASRWQNRRFYLRDQIEDFFGLQRRKLLYRRDGLSHRRAPASRKSFDQSYDLDCDYGRPSELNQRKYCEAQDFAHGVKQLASAVFEAEPQRRRAMRHGALAQNASALAHAATRVCLTSRPPHLQNLR